MIPGQISKNLKSERVSFCQSGHLGSLLWCQIKNSFIFMDDSAVIQWSELDFGSPV